jgi:hypothetical protein
MFEKKISKHLMLKRALELARSAADGSRDWQRMAQEDFLFRDGEQWPAGEKQQLEDDRRPVLTFNVTKSSIDLVRGLNDDSKVRYRATPVEGSDELLVEIINKLIYWSYEANDWDKAEDDAFETAAICGRGWVGIDFGPNPKQYGEIVIDQSDVSIREVHIDPASRRKNLKDASYICWEKWYTPEDYRSKHPKSKIDPDDLFDLGYIPFEVGVEAQALSDPEPELEYDDSDYDKELDDEYYDRNKRMLRVIHMEYWKNVDREWVQDPKTREWTELSDSGFASKKDWEMWFNATFPEVTRSSDHYVKIVDKEIWWLQFAGHEILYNGKAPIPYDGFSLVPCIAYTDLSHRTANHYGIVRLMKDAQREINKRWSQTLNLINNQVQPGLYAETDAFVDQDQAEDAIKTPGSVAYLEPGALNKGKIKERTVPAFPNATFNMEEQAQVMLRRITGINPDLLGQDRGRQEPGVVVKMRQQQGLVILRPLFNAFKHMKRELFKRQAAIILKWMPVRQMKLILGKDSYIFTQNEKGDTLVMNHDKTRAANLSDIRNVKYNIDLEETSDSMTQRMFELAAMTEMQTAGIPADPSVMISKMDLPVSEKDRWIQFVQQQQKAAANAAQFEMSHKANDQKLKHEREMLKIMLDYKSKTAKTNAQIAKDTVKLKQEMEAIGIEGTDVLLDFVAKMAAIDGKHADEQIKAEAQLKAAKEGAKNEGKDRKPVQQAAKNSK